MGRHREVEEPTNERGSLTPDASGTENPPGPGRAARPPDEGPAMDGGSALAEDEAAADEEIGGGD